MHGMDRRPSLLNKKSSIVPRLADRLSRKITAIAILNQTLTFLNVLVDSNGNLHHKISVLYKNIRALVWNNHGLEGLKYD